MNLAPEIKFLFNKSYFLKNIPFRNKVICWTWELGKCLSYVIITYSKTVAISINIDFDGWNSGQNCWRFLLKTYIESIAWVSALYEYFFFPWLIPVLVNNRFPALSQRIHENVALSSFAEPSVAYIILENWDICMKSNNETCQFKSSSNCCIQRGCNIR